MDNPIDIIVPPAGGDFIVFNSDSFTKKFDSASYYPHLTDGKASTEEINHVLREIEKVQKPFNSQLLSVLICYIIFLFTSVGFYAVFMMNFTELDIAIIAIYFVLFVAAVVFNLIIYVTRTRGIREKMKLKCKNVTEKHNQYFMKRGLRWHIPEKFPKCIELWKDEKPQNFGNQQPSWNFEGHNQPQPQQNYYQNYLGQGNSNVYNPPSQH